MRRTRSDPRIDGQTISWRQLRSFTPHFAYAAGWKFTVLFGLLYAPGTILYLWTRHEKGKQFFKPFEWVIFLVAVVLALVAIHGLATGYITI